MLGPVQSTSTRGAPCPASSPPSRSPRSRPSHCSAPAPRRRAAAPSASRSPRRAPRSSTSATRRRRRGRRTCSATSSCSRTASSTRPGKVVGKNHAACATTVGRAQLRQVRDHLPRLARAARRDDDLAGDVRRRRVLEHRHHHRRDGRLRERPRRVRREAGQQGHARTRSPSRADHERLREPPRRRRRAAHRSGPASPSLLAVLAIPGSTWAWDLPLGGLWIGLPLAVAAIVLGAARAARGRRPLRWRPPRS